MYRSKQKVLLYLFIFILQLSLPLLHSQSLLAAENTPNNPRCGQSGPVSAPTDEFYCGCTWGVVYYRGQPVSHAPVSILFKEGKLTQESVQNSGDLSPYYGMSAIDLGAKLNDLLTVTTDFAGETISRSFRARPDHEKNQEVALVVPGIGTWKSLIAGKNALALLADGNTLWSGGNDGLLALNLTTGISTTHTLPWSSQSVVALAITQNHHIWAAGAHNLAEFDGASWHNRTLPFAATLRTLHVNSSTNALWAGGGDNGSALAIYNATNDNWQAIPAISGRVEAITTDKNGDVWVGSRKGLYRHDHNSPTYVDGWTPYQVEDGLGSDDIRSLASDAHYLWVGSAPYDGDTVSPKGGISRYSLGDGSWQIFTATHGLPADADGSTALIHSLGFDPTGRVWAGTTDGVYFMATPNAWFNDNPQNNQPVVAIVNNASRVFMAREGSVEQLDPIQPLGAPPIARLNQVSVTVDMSGTLTISATATISKATASTVEKGTQEKDTQEKDTQEKDTVGKDTVKGNEIVGWDWVSDLAGPLCTTAESCTIPASILGVGKHEVSLRVQNALGTWSEKAKMQVVVTTTPQKSTNSSVYLPLVTR